MSAGPAADHGVAVDPAGDRCPRGGHGVDVTGEHARTVRRPDAPAGQEHHGRRRRPRTSNAFGRHEVAQSRRGSLPRRRLTDSAGRRARASAPRAGSAEVRRSCAPPAAVQVDRPVEDVHGRAGQQTSPPVRRSTSTSPPGNRIVTRAGARPGLVGRDRDRTRAAAAGHASRRSRVPRPARRSRSPSTCANSTLVCSGNARGAPAPARCAPRGIDRGPRRRRAPDGGCPSRPRSPSERQVGPDLEGLAAGRSPTPGRASGSPPS